MGAYGCCLDVAQGEATRGGSDWSFVGDLPGHALSPFKWYRLLIRLLMGFYPGPRAETSPFFMTLPPARHPLPDTQSASPVPARRTCSKAVGEMKARAADA